MRAVIVKAYLKRNDRDRLERFAEVLQTGMMVPGDEAAIHLRNFVLELASSKDGKGRKHLYAMTETALFAFLREERITKLRVTEQELFPLAGEDDWFADEQNAEQPQLAKIS